MRNNKNRTISIVGAGALGTALSVLVGKHKNVEVRLWDRDPKVMAQIRKIRESPSLPQIRIPQRVFVSSNLEELAEDTDIIALAVPSFGLRETAKRLSGFKSLPSILLVSKGIEKATSKLPFQVIEEILKTDDIIHLSWVGFAKNIKEKVPARLTIASKKPSLIKKFKDVFSTQWLQAEVTDDVLGIELAGALKNVLAIGIGMVLTSEKDRTKREKLVPRLISLGVKEMISLGQAMGAKAETFLGPAGEEDLRISSYPDSRNYQLGESIFTKGTKVAMEELIEKNLTVEGLLTGFPVFQLAKTYKVPMPVAEEVYRIIYDGEDPSFGVKKIIELAKTNAC